MKSTEKPGKARTRERRRSHAESSLPSADELSDHENDAEVGAESRAGDYLDINRGNKMRRSGESAMSHVSRIHSRRSRRGEAKPVEKSLQSFEMEVKSKRSTQQNFGVLMAETEHEDSAIHRVKSSRGSIRTKRSVAKENKVLSVDMEDKNHATQEAFMDANHHVERYETEKPESDVKSKKVPRIGIEAKLHPSRAPSARSSNAEEEMPQTTVIKIPTKEPSDYGISETSSPKKIMSPRKLKAQQESTKSKVKTEEVSKSIKKKKSVDSQEGK